MCWSSSPPEYEYVFVDGQDPGVAGGAGAADLVEFEERVVRDEAFAGPSSGEGEASLAGRESLCGQCQVGEGGGQVD
jgi:hypothetical protein